MGCRDLSVLGFGRDLIGYRCVALHVNRARTVHPHMALSFDAAPPVYDDGMSAAEVAEQSTEAILIMDAVLTPLSVDLVFVAGATARVERAVRIQGIVDTIGILGVVRIVDIFRIVRVQDVESRVRAFRMMEIISGIGVGDVFPTVGLIARIQRAVRICRVVGIVDVSRAARTGRVDRGGTTRGSRGRRSPDRCRHGQCCREHASARSRTHGRLSLP